MRVCADCSADISERHWHTKRCHSCQEVRERRRQRQRLSKRRHRARPIRFCLSCNANITSRHGKAKRCKPCASEHARAEKRIYNAEYRKRPGVREKIAAMLARYYHSPKGRAYYQSYRQRPDVRSRLRQQRRDRYQLPHVRARILRDWHRRRALKRGTNARPFPADWFDAQLERQHGCCERCDRRFTADLRPTLDHVVPLARGGVHAPENCQLLCGPCNSSKGAR